MALFNPVLYRSNDRMACNTLGHEGLTLTGAKMKEIQAVNAARKHAVSEGMTLEDAMDKGKLMRTYRRIPAGIK